MEGQVISAQEGESKAMDEDSKSDPSEEGIGKVKVLIPVVALLDVVAWIPTVDVWVKVVSTVVTAFVSVFVIRHYIATTRLKNVERKIKEQEYQRMRDEYLEKFGNKNRKKKK